MSRTFVIKKEDINKIKEYGNKCDYQIKIFPITMTPRMRKVQVTYIGRSDLPTKFKNSKCFDNYLKDIRTYQV